MYRSIRGVVLCLLLCSVMLLSWGYSKVFAAACTGTTQYGTVTMTANIPATGEYVLWARIQPTTAGNNLLQVEVNGDTCFSAGSTNIPAGTWSWVNYKGSTTSDTMKYTFNSTGAKTIKLLGQAADVKVDKVILIGVSEQCASNGTTPQGDGVNCETGATSTSGGGSTTPPPSQVTPDIVSANPNNVAKVEYYVNGKLLQISDGAAPFDLQDLENGTYELTTKVTYKDGTTAEAKQPLTVTNTGVRQTGIRKWVTDHRLITYIALSSLSVGGLYVLGISLRRLIHHKHMFLVHHGLAS